MKQSFTLAFLFFTHLFAFTQNDQLPPDCSSPQPGYVLQNPHIQIPRDTVPDNPAGTSALSNFGSSALAPCDSYQFLECGQTYYGHNNFGYGNDLVTYCITGAFNGPDRVYRVDIPYDMPVKFVLDILDNVDLDILILSNCQTLVCAGWSIENNPGLGVYREIADVHLTAGTYYVVIDGPLSDSYSNYNLSMDCSCSPLEEGLGFFFANEYFCDNFESFLPSGPVSDVSSRWEVWPASNFGDGVVEVNADGDQVAHFVNNNAAVSPYLIQMLDNQTSGRWRLSWRMRVEQNKSGYFNIMHQLPTFNPSSNSPANIAYRTVFSPDGTGYVRVGLNTNPNEARFNYPNGQWFNVVQIIDLNFDNIELWINDHFVRSWQFSRGVNVAQGVSQNINKLSGIGFAAENGYDYYIDDITLWKARGFPVLCNDLYDPLCIENGTISGNECEAKVGLYTELEWNKCFSVCDYGGTFMYRGDSLTGQFGPSDLAPDSLRFAPCVTAAYGNNMPVPLYTDVYAFYNDNNNSAITVTLNTANSNDVKYFLFSCNHDEPWIGKPDNAPQDGLPPCKRNQQCITTGGTITPCDQLYYIVVTGPLNATYSLKVGPPGVCPSDPPSIDCNTTESGSLLAGNGNSTFTAAGLAYNKCYVGQRTYPGRESIYKFTLQNPSQIKITANSAAPIGVFLQSFVCGNNCINYAENTGSNPEAQILTSLPAGNYYVVVDRNTTTGMALFDITLECTPISPLTTFDAFVKTFLPDGALCPADNSAQHQIKINASAFSFSNTDQLIFHYQDSGEPIGLSSPELSELWGAPGPIKTMNLPKDDEGDNKKCSFLPGDIINLRIDPTDNGSLNVFETNLIFKQVPGTNAAGQYQVNGVSYIDSIRQLTPRLFHLDKADLTFPPGDSMQTVRLQTNMFWDALVYSGDSSINFSWGVSFSPLSSAGTETISIRPWARDPLDPTSFLPRKQFIVFQGYSGNYLYQAFLRLHQKGFCPPTTTAAINASSTNICEGVPVTLTAVGTPIVAGLYTYKWSTGDTSGVITKMPAVTTSYTVTVTNINCNVTATATRQITVQSKPIMPISLGDKIMCEGGVIPTLSMSVNNQPNIAVDWYDASSGGTLLQANNLNYTPTNAVTKTYYAQSRNTSTTCVNSARTPVKLTVNPRPFINVIEKVCAINLLTYDIVLNTDADIVQSSPGVVTGNPGQYIVTGIPSGIPAILTVKYSATNCTRTEVVSAPDCSCPTVEPPVAGDSHIICSDEPIPELTVAVGANETANWFDDSGTLIAEGLTYLPSAAGVFSVYAVNLVNGCLSEFPAMVSLNIHPAVELSAGTPACSPNLQFFSVPLNTSPNVTQVTATHGIISGQNGNYLISNIPETSDVLVTAIDGNTGCVQQLFITANNCPCPALDKPVSDGDKTSCEGDLLPVLKVTVNAGETADWFNAFGQLQANGQGTTEFTPLQPGTYYAQRRNLLTGCTSVERTAVTAAILPTPALAVLDDSCEPLLTSYQVIVVTDGNGVSTVPVYPISNLNTNTFVISGIPIGISVTISAAFNGTGCSTEQTVQRNDCPCSINPPTIEGPNPVVVCLGDALPDLIASVDDPVTETVYWFDVPSGGVPLFNGEATLVFKPTLPKTYYAEARKKDAPGCVSTLRRSAAILANTPPTVSAGTDQSVCANEAIQLSGTVSGALSATWESSVLGGTFSPNASTLSSVIYTPPSGVTSVVLTLVSSDPPGPCSAISDEMVVELRPVPIIDLDTAYCSQNLLTYNVIFSVDPATASVQPNAGILNVLGGGQFQVSGISKNTDLVLSVFNAANGCSNQLFVPKDPCDCISPNVPVSKGNKEVCSNDTYPVLEVDPPAADVAVDWYEFASGGNPLAQDTLAYQPVKGGTYFAETRNRINNCKSFGRTSITLTVKPSPAADAGNDQTVCPGIPAVLTAAGTNYSYEWSNNATGKTITVPGEAATYHVTVTLNGCLATDSVSVSTWPPVFGSINVTQPVDCYENSTGVLSVSASGGAFPYTVKWSNGPATPQNANLLAGIYAATITDANTCRDTVIFDLDEPDPLEVSDTTIVWSSGTAFDGSISVTVSGGTPPYAYKWIENGFILMNEIQSSIDSLIPTEYAVIVTDANGCSRTEFYSTVDTTVSAPGVDKDIFVIVYPNPTTGQLYIQFHLPQYSAVAASVTDMLGRTVVDKREFRVMNETVELPLNTLPSGNYILHLQIEQTHIVHKVSVNRG